MPEITRIRSGKIYFTHFDDTTLDKFWSVSPSSQTQEAFSLNERAGFLRVKHTVGEEPTRIMFDIPDVDTLVLEMRNEYYPSQEFDEGGLTAFQEVKNKVELLEYFDGAKGVSVNYTHMRLRKQGRTYEGYGSKDGGKTWILIGAKSSSEMEKMGFVMHGEPSDTFVPMDIDYISVYRDTGIVVRNLQPTTKVEIFDSFGLKIDERIVRDDSDTAYLNVSEKLVPFTGFIRTTFPDATMTETDIIEFWGGDIFWNGVYLDFYINNEKLDTAIDHHLGNMKDGLIEIPVEVENPTENPVREIYIDVQPYNWYYGHQWVQIAQDSFGTPGNYQKKIYIGDIYPGERHFFWLKVTRVPIEQEAQWGAYKFRLVSTNGYVDGTPSTTPTGVTPV